jgi:hypothetical protein
MFVDEKQFAPAVEQKPPAPWRKILLDAANLLEEKGWVRGEYRSIKGFCAEGAMMHVAVGTTLYDDLNLARVTLAHHLGALNIPLWNDHPQRTKAQVIASLRAAAQGEAQ